MIVSAEACLRRPPRHFAAIPAWPSRGASAQEYELHHVPARIGQIAERGVGDVERDQEAGPCLDLIAHECVGEVCLSEVRLQVRARNDPGRASLGRGVLREVEDHGEPGHVIARPGHRNLSILVPATVSR